MDTLVFDIETQNFFTDPEVGWDNFAALKISVMSVYSYAQDRYLMFEERELPQAAPLFRESGLLVGFSSNRYDVPVLNLYFQRLPARERFNLWHKDRLDLLEEIELASGERVGLGRLAELNLGVGKDRHGSEAITLYREGRMQELKDYCTKDVELTKRLYDLYRERGYLFLPDRKTGGVKKLDLANGRVATATLF
jgi:DEAD/DEAH box helicase domain-containing protein